ncbi:MAG: hypothetical protein AB8B62_19080 [Roseobacter sp.]
MKLIRKINGLALAAAIAVTGVATSAAAFAEGLLEDIERRGALRVGMAT